MAKVRLLIKNRTFAMSAYAANSYYKNIKDYEQDDFS